MARASFDEFRNSAALGDLKAAPAYPLVPERDAMFELIRRLRGDNLFLTRTSSVLLRAMEKARVLISVDTAREVVSSMHTLYGPGVQIPVVSGRVATGLDTPGR